MAERLVIKHKETGDVLADVVRDSGGGLNLEGANLEGAMLRLENLCWAEIIPPSWVDGESREAARQMRERRRRITGGGRAQVNLRGANLRGADLAHAKLEGADLSNADLAGADLEGANLRYARLCDANLRDAILTGTALLGAVLTGADLTGAEVSGTRLDPEIPPPDLAPSSGVGPQGGGEQASPHSPARTTETEPVASGDSFDPDPSRVSADEEDEEDVVAIPPGRRPRFAMLLLGAAVGALRAVRALGLVLIATVVGILVYALVAALLQSWFGSLLVVLLALLAVAWMVPRTRRKLGAGGTYGSLFFLACLSVGYLAVEQGRAIERDLREYSHDHDWSFTSDHQSEEFLRVEALLSLFYPPDDQLGMPLPVSDDVAEIELLVTIREPPLPCWLFYYTVTNVDDWSSLFGCLISQDVPQAQTRLQVFPKTLGVEHLLVDKVALGSDEFREEFVVLCETPAVARELVTPAVQQILLGHRAGPGWYMGAHITSGGVLLQTSWAAGPEDYEHLVGMTQAIAEALP